MDILHQYHTAMGELIFCFEGTLEHFTGDGLMVFFNEPVPCPDPAARAIRMAVGMHQRMHVLTETWRKSMYQLDFGEGIAQGYATVGMIGFENRVDYAAIGSVANLTARLCAEAGGGQILVSRHVFAAVEALVHAELLGELSFKGFRQPMPVFNVVGLKETLISNCPVAWAVPARARPWIALSLRWHRCYLEGSHRRATGANGNTGPLRSVVLCHAAQR
jgi:adenylate cyclase